MKFTYEQYAVPYAPVEVREDWQRPEYMFVPDQVVGALHAIVPRMDDYVAAYERDLATGRIKPFLRDVLNEKGEIRDNRIVLTDPSFSDTQTIAAVHDTLQRVDQDFANRFDRAVKNGWLEHVAAGMAGLSEGDCARDNYLKRGDGRLATLRMRFDGTINDPVYVSHEAGHYLAEDRRATIAYESERLSQEQRVVAETQAFFLHRSRSMIPFFIQNDPPCSPPRWKNISLAKYYL